ncbi:ParB/RepB/Spo0J family partition protein [Streptomyces sp. NPDC001288]
MAASKRKDWNDLLGGKNSSAGTPEPEKPAGPPVTVLMHTIVGNPDNPRPEEDYSDDDPEFRELKASMREIGQLQPLAVVSRPVFEQAKPDAIAQAPAPVRKMIHEADWVVVTGNRRLAAARQLGWTRVDIRVQDQLGDEEGRIDEAVIIENIHRKNLAPVKEAEYLAVMVKRHGSQEKVAERIGKSQMFVSQRLALLNLAPDLRKEVDAGTLKIKEARKVARTADHGQQRAQVAELKEKESKPQPPSGPPEPPVQNRVLTPQPAPETGQSPGAVQNPVLNSPPPAPADPADSLPEPRSSGPETPIPSDGERKQVKFPYGDGLAAASFLIERMPTSEFRRMLERLMEHDLEVTETAQRP